MEIKILLVLTLSCFSLYTNVAAVENATIKENYDKSNDFVDNKEVLIKKNTQNTVESKSKTSSSAKPKPTILKNSTQVATKIKPQTKHRHHNKTTNAITKPHKISPSKVIEQTRPQTVKQHQLESKILKEKGTSLKNVPIDNRITNLVDHHDETDHNIYEHISISDNNIDGGHSHQYYSDDNNIHGGHSHQYFSDDNNIDGGHSDHFSGDNIHNGQSFVYVLDNNVDGGHSPNYLRENSDEHEHFFDINNIEGGNSHQCHDVVVIRHEHDVPLPALHTNYYQEEEEVRKAEQSHSKANSDRTCKQNQTSFYEETDHVSESVLTESSHIDTSDTCHKAVNTDKNDFTSEKKFNTKMKNCELEGSRDQHQKNSVLLNVLNSMINNENGLHKDITIKDKNVNEVIERYKCPDESKTNNEKVNIPIIENMFIPNYQENIRYTPAYTYNTKKKYLQNPRQQQPNYKKNIWSDQGQHPYKYSNTQSLSNWYHNYPKVSKQEIAYYTSPPIIYYNNIYKPDYSYIPPSYKYPFENQLRDNVRKYSENNFGAIGEKTRIPISKRNKQNIQYEQNVYSNNKPTTIYSYSEVVCPNTYLDRIWREWRKTEIYIRNLRKTAPALNPESNHGTLNKRPLSTFNQRKHVINGNGCYRNHNKVA